MSRSTAIVVPCFNEAERLRVEAFEEFVDAQPAVRFLFVNDGSRDATGEMLDRMSRRRPHAIQAHHLDRNRGKAEAVRQGVLSACRDGAEFVGFWDADLATPLDEIPRFAATLDRRPETDVVIGSRLPLMGREIRRRWQRKIAGRLFSAAARIALQFQIYDTQCGAKLFRNSRLLPAVFGTPFIARWIFDVEILARWRNIAPARFPDCLYEMPLEAWRDVAGSKLKGADFLKAAAELAAIQRRYVWANWQPSESSENGEPIVARDGTEATRDSKRVNLPAAPTANSQAADASSRAA